MMRVLICGDREWSVYYPIDYAIRQLPPGSVVIHGAARGVDTIADECAKSHGFEVLPFPADWDRLGRAAGPIRNQQMLDEGKPDVVYAFHDQLWKSKGTRNMMRLAKLAGVRVEHYGSTHGTAR